MVYLLRCALLLLILQLGIAWEVPALRRRTVIAGAVASIASGVHPAFAEEVLTVRSVPESNGFVKLTEEEEAARVARKMELLRAQQKNRQAKYDVKVLFGADYQAGKREAPKQSGGFSLPVLLPNDVGGINLQGRPTGL